MPIERGKRLGPYEVAEPIGAGGMGEVYRARDTRLDRSVAIKILPSAVGRQDELRQRFEREAKAISALNHPHICTLYDVGAEGETSYLVMELLDGETLAARIAKKMPVDEVVRVAIQIAAALDAAHRRGIIHRDLKPGNIMLTKSGVKLLDFGLARVSQAVSALHGADSAPATEIAPITSEGMILGTLHYMSPEQLEGKPVDARTDIFSFGSILYEMLTGKRPFEGDSHASVITAIMSREPPAIGELAPTVPQALVRLARQCLEKERDERWQSAHDLATELRWIAAPAGDAAVPAVGSQRRLRWLWPAIAALSLAALAATLLWRRAPVVEATPVSFTIPITGRLAQTLTHPFDISPDGNQIVFETIDGSTRSLMLRTLGDAEAVRIPGTIGASTPVFSPDSRQVAFFAEGKLKRVTLAGDEVAILAEVPPGVSMSMDWAADGTILVANLDEFRSMVQFDPVSGKAKQLAFPHLPPESRVFWPHSLDGDRFLYLELNSKAQIRLRGGSLTGSERWDYGPFTSRVLVTGNRILYVRDGALTSRDFDRDAMEMRGEPKTIVPAIYFYAPLGLGGFSVTEKTLVYLAPDVDAPATWFDRNGRELGTIGPPAATGGAFLSRDGKRVALAINDSRTATRDLWICDIARGTSQQLTTTPWSEGLPHWSPDDSEIGFFAEREGPPHLYRMAVNGGEAFRITEPRVIQRMSDWSPAGNRIHYDERDPKTRRDLWSVNPDGSDRKRLIATPFDERSARISPDGKWMAYIADNSGTYEVWLARSDGAGSRIQISTTTARETAWRDDGRELFWVTNHNQVFTAPVTWRDGTPDLGPSELLFRVPGGQFTEMESAEHGTKFLIVHEKITPSMGPLRVITGWQNTGAK